MNPAVVPSLDVRHKCNKRFQEIFKSKIFLFLGLHNSFNWRPGQHYYDRYDNLIHDYKNTH